MSYNEEQMHARLGTTTFGGVEVTESLFLISLGMPWSQLARCTNRWSFPGTTSSNCISNVPVPSLRSLAYCGEDIADAILAPQMDVVEDDGVFGFGYMLAIKIAMPNGPIQ